MTSQKINNAVPNALRNFDQLPDAAHVRQPTVEALFGISSATVWRRVRAGILKPHRFGERTTTFNVGELRAVLSAKVD